jgi:hypothetical protein
LYVLYPYIQNPHMCCSFISYLPDWLKFCQSVSLVVIETKQPLLMGINRCTGINACHVKCFSNHIIRYCVSVNLVIWAAIVYIMIMSIWAQASSSSRSQVTPIFLKLMPPVICKRYMVPVTEVQCSIIPKEAGQE